MIRNFSRFELLLFCVLAILSAKLFKRSLFWWHVFDVLPIHSIYVLRIWDSYLYLPFECKGSCLLPLQSDFLPVPYMQYSDGSFGIIYPNRNGFLELEHGAKFYVSCTNGRFTFQDPRAGRIDKELTCHDGENVAIFNGRIYSFQNFLCTKTPNSDTLVFRLECRGPNTVVAQVGFKVQHTFLPQYGICFDMKEHNSLYTWYEARVPNKNKNIFDKPQLSIQDSSELLYDDLDVNAAYTVESQVSTIIWLQL